VPVEAEHWTHSPFSGDLADGCVWGRGTLDMKSMVTMELMTMLLLARHRVSLKRDVIFAAAKFAAQLGIKSYGFSPLKLQVGEPFNELIHGHDERVPVRALTFGVSAL
jgi:acetylornithine deacetylase/succinyl-diaminopimelate desuccinylase-like protein